MKRLYDGVRLSITWWWDDWSLGLHFGTVWVLDLGPLMVTWAHRPRVA